ncbi:MAG: hypothetical protein ACYC4K_09885, partial [Thiobacillus sp.]
MIRIPGLLPSIKNEGVNMLNSTYTQCRAIISFVALFLFASFAIAAPQITEFEVDQVTTLRPGTAVDFTLSGTPRARATVRISGIPRVIALKETGPGFYEGRYVVRKKDRISSRAAAVATLSQGNSHTIARLGQSLVASAAPAPAPVEPAPTAIAISKFSVDSYDSLEPGAELEFTLLGTPAGRASYTIENVIANRRMREVRPGVYTGQYTIRRQDKLPAVMNVIATLQANGQIVRAQLDKQIVNNGGSNNNAPASANPFSHFAPRDNESIPYSKDLTVSGDFEDDPRKGGIDPRSIQILFDGRDVTSQSSITTHNFSYRPTNVTPGRHSVEVRGRDSNGNIVRSNWYFRMLDAAPVASFPLDITSPRDGAEVGSGVIEVRGRTLPNASVQVAVTAGILGLS